MTEGVDCYSFIYIIGPRVGPVKVGVSGCAEARFKQLQNKSHEQLILMGKYPVGTRRALAVERYTHWLLREKCIGGEWFDVSCPEAAQAIHDAIATDVHPEYPMPPINTYPRELKGGDYVRTKLAPGVLEKIHKVSGGLHSEFVRDAINEKLAREAEPPSPAKPSP